MRTLSDIENGVRKASPGTYAMLENKLAWAPGSIDTILAGGEPKELVVKLHRDGPEPRHHPTSPFDALSCASTEELLLELRRRIIRPRDRRSSKPDEWDDGLDAQGSWPGSASIRPEPADAQWPAEAVRLVLSMLRRCRQADR